MDNSKKKEQSLLKQATMQIAAGGSAGFVEVLIMHPLDLVKTRLQIQTKKPINQSITSSTSAGVKGEIQRVYYKGVIDCFAKMYRAEGISSYYKGIIPPILAETPKRATKFFCFEQYKKFVMFGSDKPTPITYSLAGLGAGVTEAIVCNPFEVVKVAMQSNTGKSTEVPTTWTVTKSIVRKDGLGLKGLNKGVTATIGRNGTFNMIYFGFYHSVKEYFPAYEDSTKEFFRKVTIGFLSGTIASIANIPFDVAKSRIQGPQPIPGQIKYKSTFRSMVIVAKEEGFLALYKGLVPKVLRLGPGGAIMLLVFEYAYDYLQKTF